MTDVFVDGVPQLAEAADKTDMKAEASAMAKPAAPPAADQPASPYAFSRTVTAAADAPGAGAKLPGGGFDWGRVLENQIPAMSSDALMLGDFDAVEVRVEIVETSRDTARKEAPAKAPPRRND